MNTEEIRQKLHHYIEIAEEKKLKAIFTMVEQDIEEPYDHWNDVEFVTEIERRTMEMESGEAKTYTWDEVKQRAEESLSRARSKK